MANFGRRLTQGIFRSNSPPAKPGASEDEKVEAYLAKWLTDDCKSLSMGGLGLTRFPHQLLQSTTLEELVLDDNEIASFPSFAPPSAVKGKGKKSQKKFRTSTLVKFGKSDPERERRKTLGSRPANFAPPSVAGGPFPEIGRDTSACGYRKLATSLHTLILSRNSLTKIDGGFKEALCLFSARLKKLDLSQNPIEDPIAMLEFISQNLGVLESLNVSRIDLRSVAEKAPTRGPKWLSIGDTAAGSVPQLKKSADAVLVGGEDLSTVTKQSSEPTTDSEPETQRSQQHSLARSRSLSAGSLAAAAAIRLGVTATKQETQEADAANEEIRERSPKKKSDEKKYSLLVPCTSPLCLITCGEKVTMSCNSGGDKKETLSPTEKREARMSMHAPSCMQKNDRGKRRSLSSSTEYKATKLQRHLQELSIKECHLNGFPTHLPKLSALTKLDLSYNYIYILPEEIGMLTGLTHLTLIACSCVELPESLGKLTNLEELYLDFNSIREFPSEAAEGLVNLRQLFMPNNNLTEIPKCIVDFDRDFCLPMLEFFDLNGNPIDEDSLSGSPLDDQPWAKATLPPGAPANAEPAIVRFTRFTEGKSPSCILEADANGTGGLFLGCGLCAQNKHELRRLGIKSVLTMARGMAPVYPVEFSYMNVEVEDAESESIDKHLEKAISFIESSRNIGGVLVHCSAGVSRSSSVVIAYLMQSKSMSYDDAHQHVLDRRPIVRPNPGFVQQLRLFEKALNSKEQCIIS